VARTKNEIHPRTSRLRYTARLRFDELTYLPTYLPANSMVSSSHLPPSNGGIYTAQASAIIDAPAQVVWDILLDLSKYPEWCARL
jgi:hypothetical protein